MENVTPRNPLMATGICGTCHRDTITFDGTCAPCRGETQPGLPGGRGVVEEAQAQTDTPPEHNSWTDGH